MAQIFEKKDRHVIPNWRSFENTSKLGELNGSTNSVFHSTFKPDISDLLEDWVENKNIGIAGDLLSTAITCNQQDNPKIIEISKYILANKKFASNALINTARLVLHGQKEGSHISLDAKSIDQFAEGSDLSTFYFQINSIKKRLIENPYNSILWVELARYYAILGNNIKAEKAIRNALFISPENRYILRSMIRFYLHIGDIDFPHDFLRKRELTKTDPWLIATEISLSTIRERGSRFAKKGLSIVESNKYHPFNITELASSLATLELKNGKIKSSRNLFKKALIHPNDNTLAQIGWASQEEITLKSIVKRQINVLNSFEAAARESYANSNWKEAIKHSNNWFLDLPFSRSAILFGSEVASNKLRDIKLAESITAAGILSHPQDTQLLNNVIYYLCLQNKLDEASHYLSNVRKEDFQKNGIHKICLTATLGLYNFRKGFFEIGRNYYYEAIKEALNFEFNIVYCSAYINYCREEILAGKEDCSALMPKIEEIINSNTDIDIINDAITVKTLFNNTVRK